MKKKPMNKTSISHYWDEDVLAWLKKDSKRQDRSVSWLLNNYMKEIMSRDCEK